MIFECRLARLLHAEGAFVRRAVDLQPFFDERFTVTDIDVLAVSFSPSLETRVLIAECKTTEGRNAPSAGDRLLWGTGVRQLVPGADRHLFASLKPVTDRTRRLAERLGAEVVDERDLRRREALLGLAHDDLSGPHDPELVRTERDVATRVKRDDELRRVWGFAVSDFWLMEDHVLAIKRALGALRLIQRRWHPELPAGDIRTLEWLAGELLVALVVALTRVAGECYRHPPDVFEARFVERLAEGIVPYRVMQELSRDVDRYLMALLKQAGVDATSHLDQLGAMSPSPPPYAEPLHEVVQRLAAQPRAASQLARVLDERLAARRGSTAAVGESRTADENAAAPLLKLISTFLRGQLGLTDALVSPLVDQDASPATGTESDDDDGPTKAQPGLPPTESHTEASGPPVALIRSPSPASFTQNDPVPTSHLVVDTDATELTSVEYEGTDLQPWPARTLLIALRNEGDDAVTITHAQVRSPEVGALEAVELPTLPDGSRGGLRFALPAPIASLELSRLLVRLDLAYRIGADKARRVLRADLTGHDNAWEIIHARDEVAGVLPQGD